ncbi:Phytochrome [Dactylellina cionopaga]|nr:Phytochrome [Dactylellina cionopaga]
MSSSSVITNSEEFLPYKIANDDFTHFSQVSQQNHISDGKSRRKTLQDFNSGDYLQLHSTKELISYLIEAEVEGPLEYMELAESRGDKFIGEGGQFSVHECHQMVAPSKGNPRPWTCKAVVKKPKWWIKNNEGFNLASKEHAQRLHDLVLEVLVLCHESLSRHRNIVKLYGWAYDQTWHRAPVLILERALGNLETLFGESNETSDDMVRWHLCLDIAEGLFALHEAGITHGDLKPSNILVFRETDDYVKYVAKLADFGLSVNEMTPNSEKHALRGWTSGWVAPEIKEYTTREKTTTVVVDFRAADIYSLGLLIWSIVLLETRTPRIETEEEASDTFLRDLANFSIPLNSDLVVTLTWALPKLLSTNPLSRPSDFTVQLEDCGQYYTLW